MIFVKISDDEIDLAKINWASLTLPGCGACDTFFGMVRAVNHGRTVEAVSYDAFVPLAEKTLLAIAAEAQEEWATESTVYIQHRTGKLKVGEVSVVIAVHTPHRHEAFQMCKYVIEQLKLRAPIWKKEFYTDGETEWLKGHELCAHTDLI